MKQYDVWVNGKIVNVINAATWAQALTAATEIYGSRCWVTERKS